MNLSVWEIVLCFLNNREKTNLVNLNPNNMAEEKFISVTSACSTDQKQALRKLIFSTENQMIVGGPGTGKSYITQIATKYLSWKGQTSEVCAWTGLAAQNINGRTLSSLIPLYRIYNWDIKYSKPRMNQNKPRCSLNCDVLFIDEISMLDAVKFEKMLYLLRDQNIRVCVLGDFLQLPPMYPENKDCVFVFESKFGESFNVSCLTTCHRQNNLHFIQIINKIGRNNFDEDVRQFLYDRHRAYVDEGSKVIQYPHLYQSNLQVDRHNQISFDNINHKSIIIPVCIDKIVEEITTTEVTHEAAGQETITYDTTTTTIYDNYYSQKTPKEILCDAEENIQGLKNTISNRRICEVHLKPGCCVMFTRNVYHHVIATTANEFYSKRKSDDKEQLQYIDIVNGTRCIIRQILNRGLIVDIPEKKHFSIYFPLRYYRIYYHSSCRELGKQILQVTKRYANITYYPMTLSYALNIYKSQGLTMDNVVLDLRGLHTANNAYVAISRCRTPSGVYVQNYGTMSARLPSHPRIIQFYKWIQQQNRSHFPSHLVFEPQIPFPQWYKNGKQKQSILTNTHETLMETLRVRKRSRGIYELEIDGFYQQDVFGKANVIDLVYHKLNRKFTKKRIKAEILKKII
jgi:hypothetical protein